MILDRRKVDSVSPRYRHGSMDEMMYHNVMRHLQIWFPERRYHSHLIVGPGLPMRLQILTFDYVIVRGRKYWAYNRSVTPKNSQVLVEIADGEVRAGELMDIVAVGDTQSIAPDILLGCVRWLVPIPLDEIVEDNNMCVL